MYSKYAHNAYIQALLPVIFCPKTGNLTKCTMLYALERMGLLSLC